jgi:ectoine hydroxylase-related dioxygenase (phytanoyl-CoA dioxygenase family)
VSANGGSTRLPDAVPMLCERGDIAICNRQCLHASFANNSPDRRVTFVWGFFRHDAVLDVEVDMPAPRADIASARRRYTAETIRERSRIVQLAIDARQQHWPDEVAYRYAPCAAEEHRQWSVEERKAELLRYAAGTIFV